MRVYATGATGLVGSHVAERLRAAGHEVVALVRPASDAAFLRGIGARLVTGDLDDPPERLAEGMRDCDAVVHAAALVYRGPTWEAVRAANVVGTERVLRAAALAGVRRAVHVSSVAVYGASGGRTRRPEESWLDGDIPEANHYARSKREAELAAWRVAEETGLRLSTARPGVVYGERDRTATPILARMVELPVLPLPGGGEAAVSVVYAGNVARAIVAMLERESTIGRAYNLAVDEPVTARQVLTWFAAGLGRTVRILPVPAALARGAAAAGEALTKLLPGVPNADLRRAVDVVLRGNPYVSERARAELGWGAAEPAAETLRRTAEWWKTHADPRQDRR